MTARRVYIPDRGWVSLGAYVAAVKKAKAHPDAEFSEGLRGRWPTRGRQIVAQFRAGMNDRISAGIPYSRRGVGS